MEKGTDNIRVTCNNIGNRTVRKNINKQSWAAVVMKR
jgi:hypothetical protein